MEWCESGSGCSECDSHLGHLFHEARGPRYCINSICLDFKASKVTKYFSTKKYGHERGYLHVFRQWNKIGHCRFIHGYSLEFEFKFGANELDERNWVVDFGGLN